MENRRFVFPLAKTAGEFADFPLNRIELLFMKDS